MAILLSVAARFNNYADDFELTFADDDRTRLETYFHQDAVYSTSGFHATQFEGRAELLNALRTNISNFDRKCDSRALVTIQGPNVDENVLTRTWKSEFTVQGAESLVIEGCERVTYSAEGLIVG